MKPKRSWFESRPVHPTSPRLRRAGQTSPRSLRDVCWRMRSIRADVGQASSLTTVLSQYTRPHKGEGANSLRVWSSAYDASLPWKRSRVEVPPRAPTSAPHARRRSCPPKPWRRRTRSNQYGPVVSTRAHTPCTRAVWVEIPAGLPFDSSSNGQDAGLRSP